MPGAIGCLMRDQPRDAAPPRWIGDTDVSRIVKRNKNLTRRVRIALAPGDGVPAAVWQLQGGQGARRFLNEGFIVPAGPGEAEQLPGSFLRIARSLRAKPHPRVRQARGHIGPLAGVAVKLDRAQPDRGLCEAAVRLRRPLMQVVPSPARILPPRNQARENLRRQIRREACSIRGYQRVTEIHSRFLHIPVLHRRVEVRERESPDRIGMRDCLVHWNAVRARHPESHRGLKLMMAGMAIDLRIPGLLTCL